MPMRYTNEEGYSLSIAAWLANDDYNHSPVDGPYVSVTGLLKPMRVIVLDQRAKAAARANGDMDVIDISQWVPSRLGTAIHSGIESTWNGNFQKGLRLLGYPEDVIKRILVNPTKKELAAVPNAIPVYMERRAFKKVGKYTVGGKMDFVGGGTLEDFKSMGVFGYMKGDKDEEQMLQGSLYRWLNQDIITSDYMLIQQIFTDWSKLDARIKASKGYPPQRVLAKRLNLLSIEDTQQWVDERVNAITVLENAPENELPRCTKKELWQDEPVYKYYKNPASMGRSTKNFDNYPEAHARLLKDKSVGVVKEIPAMVRRCGYCNGFDLCTQKNEYADAGILQLP